MSVKIHRALQNEHGTFGILSFEGKPLCNTLELPWKQNKPKVSCIPEGTYYCVPHNGKDFSNVWRLETVEGRSGILIHEGNFLKNSTGCILVGDSIKAFPSGPGIGNSQETLDMLRKKLPKEFTLQVIDP